MEKLEVLPDIARLSDRVVRILGQNPGKFTLQGTNTYLVGKRPPYILIDTGEGHAAYPSLLESALHSIASHPSAPVTEKPSCLVSDIVITHYHRDHFGGLSDVLALLQKLSHTAGTTFVPPRILKYPSPPSPSQPSDHETALKQLISALPSASYVPPPPSVDTGEGVLHPLADGQCLSCDEGDTTLEVLHTPGHTPDSICLLLNTDQYDGGQDEGKTERSALFAADSVLGQGTAVFEDLGAYIGSLQRILGNREAARVGSDKAGEKVSWDFGHVYPGHGPVVVDGPALIASYIAHRMEREAQILRILSLPTPSPASLPPLPALPLVSNSEEAQGDARRTVGNAWTLWALVATIYSDYPQNLWLPAAHGVRLHLQKLEGEGRAHCTGGESITQQWELNISNGK